MITSQFSNLNEADKVIYFEAASNPILQNLINLELKTVEEQILLLDKLEGETDSDFRRRFDRLKINRQLLLDFYEINQKVITDIQNLHRG